MARRCIIRLSRLLRLNVVIRQFDSAQKATSDQEIKAMDMCSLSATITSCIGGKDEKFAVQVCTTTPSSVYFVYKTMDEFIALWEALKSIARDIQRYTCCQDEHNPVENKLSLFAKWIASVVNNYAFRQIIRDLRAQEKETMSTLNMFLQFLVARLSALSKDNGMLASPIGSQFVTLVTKFFQPQVAAFLVTESIVELSSMDTTSVDRKRSIEEMRPEDGEMQQRRGLFPTQSSSERTVKTQKFCMREWVIPPANKLGMVASMTSRRRVFAEVDF
ncbi:uncharacterized protein PHALS_09889 [Plasmopara halstedii]|uniref:Uncharacterized protein n=1 Tax=Plasmopara halstedii TaxID=4781 RepID=A0A0N7L4U5_PLAHL|nr:uncharacterized protein PHALS_09889 [Plasmopara halstedii]CEG39651.1 hypothetical protein PHALS_09889 [Plasmopara halstedii]|eukprot:XP_024576020.1 hypothetical protein PHALS_09889 [Plasmopara halstedii]